MDEYPLDLYVDNYRLFYISHIIGAKVLQDAIINLAKGVDPLVQTFQEFEEKNLKGKKRKLGSKEFEERCKIWKEKPLDELWKACGIPTLDITYLYRVLQANFNVTEFPKLKKLKDYRNEVCHSLKQVVDKETYDRELKKVGKIFMEIYKDMEHVKGWNIELRMTDVNKEIDEMDSHDFEQFKKEFDQNICNIVIIEGRKDLHTTYKKYKGSTPFSWMWGEEFNEFDICKIFTPLEEQNGKLIDMKYTLKLFKQTQVIIVSGLAGSGKTSLCRFITNEWLKSVVKGLDKSDSTEDIGEFSLVIHIELREFIGKCLDGNIAYTCINYLMPAPLSNIKILAEKKHKIEEDILEALQSLNILYIIDGFDEATEEGKKIVSSIIEKFKGSKIILTTRLEYKQEAENMIKNKFKSVKICGFDKKGRKDFIEKIFTVMVSDPSERDKELREFQQMNQTNADVLNEHLKLPLTTALLVTLWYFKPEERDLLKSKTATELYETMIGLWKERVNDKLTNFSQEIYFGEKLLEHLSKVAWINLNDDRLYLEKKQVDNFQEECKKCSIPNYEVISQLLVFKGEQFFMHKTEMEFLAALHVTQKLKEGKCVSELYSMGKTKKFREHCKYLTGCMFKESLLDNEVEQLMMIIDKADIEKTDYNYWQSLVRESHENGALCSQIECRLPKEEWELDDATVLAGIRLLTFTNPKVLSLKIYNDPYEIEGFLNVWKRLPQTISNRSKFKVKLILRHSSNMAGSWDTDEFLSSLDRWGELTFYEGHLGEHCGKTLKNCYKLKHMLARVSNVNVLKALSNSLKHNRKRRLLQTLHIILDTPKERVTDVPMEFKKHLDITIPSSEEKDIEWINETVFILGERIGCRNLTLRQCDMTQSGIRSLVDKLANDETVTDKLTLYLAVDLGEDTEMELKDYVNRFRQFEIEFL